MKKIAVIPNPSKDCGLKITSLICKKLISFGIDVYIEEKNELGIDEVRFYTTLPKDTELIIVVGGDGSVLDASVQAISVDAPILGVNLGRVGYLSEVEPDNLDILDRLISGEYKIEEKMLLSVACKTVNKTVTCTRLAVNDIIISHDNFLGIADFRLEAGNGEFVKYRADGMILSTPAGCTAYSLSAGGPIIAHDVDSIIATPICPHSFFNRSIIFNPTEIIKVRNGGATPLNISVDGRCFSKINSGDECVVSQADKKLKMLTFSENNMFSTLFKKMKILEDIT